MALSQLNVELALITKNFDKELGKVQRKLNRFSRNLQSIGQELTTSISVPLLGIGAAAVKSFADFERLSKGLETVTGSAAAAETEMSKLQEAAQNPGLSLNQAISGSIKLQSVGLDANQAREALLQFGNALALAGGTSTDLDGVSLALTQIISKGKISAEEINQLAERVPQVRNAIESAFGTSDSESLQKLGISAEEFVAKVTEEFAKLPRAQNTLSNTFENAGQAITRSLVEIGNEINNAFNLQELVQQFTSRIDAAVQAFRSLDDQTKRNIVRFAAVAAAVGPVFLVLGKVVAIGGSIVSTLRLLNSGFVSLASGVLSLANPVGLTIAGVAALATGLVIAYRNSETFRNIVNGVGSALAEVGQIIASAASPAISALGDLFRELVRAGQFFVRANIEAFRQFRALIGPLVARIAERFSGLGESIGRAFRNVAGIVTGVIRGVINIFAEFVGVISEGFSSLLDTITAIEEGDYKRAFNSFVEGFRKSNPITAIITEGGRLAGAFSEGFQSGIDNNPIDRVLEAYREGYSTLKEDIESDPIEFKVEEASVSNSSSSFNRNSSSGASSRSPLTSFGAVGTLDLIPEKINAIRTESELTSSSLTDLGFQTQEAFNLMETNSEGLTTAQEKIRNTRVAFEELSEQISNSLGVAISDLAGGVGEAIGNIASGLGSVAQIGSVVFAALAGVLDRVGKAAIETGVAILAIQLSLKTLNPFVAIAAGTALVALSKIIKNKLVDAAPGLAEGGIIPPGFPNDTFPARLSSGEAVIPLDRLNQFGGDQVITTRISGRDLLILLEREENAQRRTIR